MTDGPDLSDPSLYINRELSWLAFNERVLAQAKSDAHPPLERVKFLAIAANNLDEFFMVRVATLARQRRTGYDLAAPDGLTTGQCLTMVRTRAEEMLREIADCWDNTLAPMLGDEEITIVEPADYNPQVRQFLEDYFSQSVCPVLTPLAFDPRSSFSIHLEPQQEFCGCRQGRRTHAICTREGSRRSSAIRAGAVAAWQAGAVSRSRCSRTSSG